MWISRRDYDDAVQGARDRGGIDRQGEIARLHGDLQAERARADRLVEALVRLARHDAGMPEVEALQRKPQAALTPELRAYVGQFSGAFRGDAETTVQVRLDNGEDPDEILRSLTGA